MHKQMQQFYHQVDIEESIGTRARQNADDNQLYNDDSYSQSCSSQDKLSNEESDLKKPSLKKPKETVKGQDSPSSSEKYAHPTSPAKPLKSLDEAAAQQDANCSPCDSNRHQNVNHISSI